MEAVASFEAVVESSWVVVASLWAVVTFETVVTFEAVVPSFEAVVIPEVAASSFEAACRTYPEWRPNWWPEKRKPGERFLRTDSNRKHFIKTNLTFVIWENASNLSWLYCIHISSCKKVKHLTIQIERSTGLGLKFNH